MASIPGPSVPYTRTLGLRFEMLKFLVSLSAFSPFASLLTLAAECTPWHIMASQSAARLASRGSTPSGWFRNPGISRTVCCAHRHVTYHRNENINVYHHKHHQFGELSMACPPSTSSLTREVRLRAGHNQHKSRSPVGYHIETFVLDIPNPLAHSMYKVVSEICTRYVAKRNSHSNALQHPPHSVISQDTVPWSTRCGGYGRGGVHK